MLANGGEAPDTVQAAACLDFRILGPVEVADGTGALLDLGSRKQRAVLTLLVLNAPHVAPLDQMIDRLWADEPPSSATGTLQAYISQLRRILEPLRSPRSPARVLRTREPGYLLDISPDQVDANRFSRAVEEAQAALADGRAWEAERSLDAALGAWRGEPLADFSDRSFVGPTVARLTEARLSALSTRAEAWLLLGRFSEAAVEAGHLLDLDPYREGSWALLMRALYRDRRQAEALAAYQRCRTLLGDELGLDPSLELRRLEQAILDQDESLEGSWPSIARGEEISPARGDGSSRGEDVVVPRAAREWRVPAPRGRRLVGREPHLHRIRERVRDTARGAGGVLLVSGESGVGKTRLAEAAAEIAGELGVTPVWSRCVEGRGAPAFWPWIQVLTALEEEAEAGAGGLEAVTREAAGVENVIRRLTGADGASVADDPDTARFLLHDAVARALSRRAGAAPVLILMEDVHWADAASLKLLTFLGGDLHRVPLLVLATLRPEAAEARPALTDALGDLVRQRGTERMNVTAFTREQVADYLDDAGPDDPGRSGRADIGPDPALARALYDRTGGNPFFLGEVLRLLDSVSPLDQVAAADVTSLSVPEGVRDVITQRVSRLPEDSQTLLRA
ncbi:BTAD domain-containing putative transcriptional regulator, partial [Streptosporangium sp. NPDC001682]